MAISITENPSDKYSVNTEVYQGPLDLLLQLIERAELDIGKLAISQVTDQFLDYMRSMQERRADRVSEFLLLAARLMQIKSEALLPRPVIRMPDEEDPGEALVQQLIMYKRFKQIATELARRQSENLRSYVRLAAPPKIEGKLDLSSITLGDLHAAALQAHANQEPLAPLGRVVQAHKITIREKISLIAKRLTASPRARFLELVKDSPSRPHVVMTFLAMLELVRLFRISATQAELFGDINLERDPDWKEDLDFELEFAE